MITVLLASYNGSHTLPRCLRALEMLKPPVDGWKLLAVDNGSTDDTAQILGSFRSRLPLQIIQHKERGKNRALNAALEHIDGDLIALTDDDTIPDVNWLVALECAARKHPDRALFGGAIIPEWETQPESWVTQQIPLGVTFALTSPLMQEGEIFPGLIWGPNMMVRREVFRAGHRFAEDVGPGPGHYIMGSETEFNLRIASYGYRTWYTPSAAVRHIIRPFQLRRAWILKRAFRFGRNMWRQGGDRQAPATLGVPNWMIRRMSVGVMKATFGFVSLQGSVKVMPILWDVSHDCGYIYQAHQDRTLRDAYSASGLS